MVVMWLIGGLLIWLAIKKDYEPALLLPMGFGAILVNLPDTGVLGDNGIIQWLYNVGIGASEAFPLLLFVGIGAMIDFGPLLSNPKMLLFGGAAQFGRLPAAGRYVCGRHRRGGRPHRHYGFSGAEQ